MSYMTPYFFSGSANMSMSIWMRSNAYAPKVGLALSGTVSKLAEGSLNAWQAESTYSCAAIRTVLPSDAVYVIENTSTTDAQEGAFGMYLAQAETSSVQAGFTGSLFPITANSVVPSPRAGRVFIPSSTSAASTNIFYYTTSLQVFNSRTYAKEQEWYGTGFALSDGAGSLIGRSGSRYLVDVVYNSVDDQVYALTGEADQLDGGGAVGLKQGYLEIYNSSGSVLVESHSLGSFVWGIAQFFGGYLIYNPDKNHLLVTPSNAGFGTSPLSYSIFDCTTKTVLHSALPANRYYNGCYNSSSGYYYLPDNNWPAAAIKIDTTTFTASATNITNSWILSYFPELGNVIIGNGGAFQDNFVPVTIFDGTTESAIATIPGIYDSETQCVYDSCQKCIVFSDDAAGDIGYGAGGQEWVYSGSWEPKNFLVNVGAWAAAFDSATSTVWATNYSDYGVAVIRTSVTSQSILLPSQSVSPPAPSFPINLMVTSGSAILRWERSGSAPVDYYIVEKSPGSQAGPYSYLTQSTVTGSRDTDIAPVNSYWYRVAAIATGVSSSFSNEAVLDVIPCNSASFTPIVYSGYLPYASGSTYRNYYGVIIPLSVPTSLSASLWLRSPDFDAYLTIADSAGNVVSESNYDGWSPTGDVDNAALACNFPSGTYSLEVSSYNNAIGRYNLIISPGATLECTWSNGYETATTDYIETSDVVVVGEQGTNFVFFNTLTGQTTVNYFSNGTQGCIYSPVQDRVFGWAYERGDGVNYTMSIIEFDNTGSQVGATRYPRKPVITAGGSTISSDGTSVTLNGEGTVTDFIAAGVQPGDSIFMYTPSTSATIYSVDTTSLVVSTGSTHVSQSWQITPQRGAMDFSGYLSYDKKRDRILFYGYNWPQKGVLWDCATKTTVTTMSLAVPSHNELWGSCYSEVTDTFYLGVPSHFGNSYPMMKLDAGTYSSSVSALSTSVVVDYISASALMVVRNNAGKVAFIDPVSESIVATVVDLPSPGALYEAGGRGDQCSNTYTLAIDPRSGDGGVTNHPCMAFIDRNTYLPSNYVVINGDNPDPGGFSPDGWYQYSIALSPKTSKVYSSQVDYDTYTGRIYSILPTTTYMPTLPRYTPTSADTASCMTFKQQYQVTGSFSGSGTTGFVCSTKSSGSATLAISNFEIDLNIGGFPWHNYITYFMTADGSQTLATYTGSYVHTLSGKNAVHCYGKYYMLDDGTMYQTSWYPTSGSNMLVFDNSGSFLTSIALPYPARDWDTDGTYVYTMCNAQSGITMSRIDPTTDTVDQSSGLIVDYSWTPAILSPTASANQPIGLKQYPMFGRFITPDGTYFYMNCIGNVGDPGHAADTVVYLAGGWGAYTGQYLDMATGSFTGWKGGAAWCPLTNTMFWGASHTGSNCVIETTMNLAVVRVIDITFNISTIVWNRTNRTMEFYSDDEAGPGTNNGAIYVYDPATHITACGFWATNNVGGPAGGNGTDGSGGYNIDVNPTNGDIYFPQRIDSGSASPATGSIKVYQV